VDSHSDAHLLADLAAARERIDASKRVPADLAQSIEVGLLRATLFVAWVDDVPGRKTLDLHGLSVPLDDEDGLLFVDAYTTRDAAAVDGVPFEIRGDVLFRQLAVVSDDELSLAIDSHSHAYELTAPEVRRLACRLVRDPDGGAMLAPDTVVVPERLDEGQAGVLRVAMSTTGVERAWSVQAFEYEPANGRSLLVIESDRMTSAHQGPDLVRRFERTLQRVAGTAEVTFPRQMVVAATPTLRQQVAAFAPTIEPTFGRAVGR